MRYRFIDDHRTTWPIEVQWSGGRWMRISERRTSDGGYVGVWTDVTEIKLAEQRLTTAIEAMDSGFALFDSDDRLLIHNKGFVDHSVARNFGGDARGRSFKEIMRAFANDDVSAVEAIGAREEWVERRLERHRNPPAEPFEQQLTDGTWVRVSERRTADGGRLHDLAPQALGVDGEVAGRGRQAVARFCAAGAQSFGPTRRYCCVRGTSAPRVCAACQPQRGSSSMPRASATMSARPSATMLSACSGLTIMPTTRVAMPASRLIRSAVGTL